MTGLEITIVERMLQFKQHSLDKHLLPRRPWTGFEDDRFLIEWIDSGL